MTTSHTPDVSDHLHGTQAAYWLFMPFRSNTMKNETQVLPERSAIAEAFVKALAATPKRIAPAPAPEPAPTKQGGLV
jgi:uncharacterized protein YqcC (DUF446 family)